MIQQPSFSPRADLKLDSRDCLWLGLAIGLILTIAFLLPVHPNDFWWYLRLGGEIVSQGGIPQAEAWSSSQAGQPVVYHAWLASLAFYGIYQAGGITAVVLARGLFLMGFYIFIYMAARQEGAGSRLAAGLIILAVLVGCSNWGVRPQILTYPLFGLGLWVLVGWHHGRDRWLWLLPVATLLWVNLHGSFPLLFLLAGAAMLCGKGDRRRLGLALVTMLLASMLNPRGYGAWLYFGKMLADPSVRRFSSEWKPAALDGWQSALFFGWLLASIPLAAYAIRRLHLTYWLWWFGFGWLALSGIRNIIWFSAILVVVSAAMLGTFWIRKNSETKQRVNSKINFGFSSALVLLTLLFLPGLRQRWWSSAPPTLSPDTPIQAADWLANQEDIGGKMWNDLDFSSYLIYALPEHPVWIDTRFEIYPPERWALYQAISAADVGWQEWLEGQDIGLIVANNHNQPELIDRLGHLPGWCLRYKDSVSTVFTRSGIGGDCPAAVAGLGNPGQNP
jgi:hypothetical protein